MMNDEHVWCRMHVRKAARVAPARASQPLCGLQRDVFALNLTLVSFLPPYKKLWEEILLENPAC